MSEEEKHIEYGELCHFCGKPIERGEAWAGYGIGSNFHVKCVIDAGATAVVAIPAKAAERKA